MFSIASGELVYRLSYTENNDTSTKSAKKTKSKAVQNESIIKSICINTKNKYQLLSFHIGGRVCLWDYEDGLLLKVDKTFLVYINYCNMFYRFTLSDIRNEIDNKKIGSH